MCFFAGDFDVVVSIRLVIALFTMVECSATKGGTLSGFVRTGEDILNLVIVTTIFNCNV